MTLSVESLPEVAKGKLSKDDWVMRVLATSIDQARKRGLIAVEETPQGWQINRLPLAIVSTENVEIVNQEAA